MGCRISVDSALQFRFREICYPSHLWACCCSTFPSHGPGFRPPLRSTPMAKCLEAELADDLANLDRMGAMRVMEDCQA
jgi:hypothetical protein